MDKLRLPRLALYLLIVSIPVWGVFVHGGLPSVQAEPVGSPNAPNVVLVEENIGGGGGSYCYGLHEAWVLGTIRNGNSVFDGKLSEIYEKGHYWTYGPSPYCSGSEALTPTQDGDSYCLAHQGWTVATANHRCEFFVGMSGADASFRLEGDYAFSEWGGPGSTNIGYYTMYDQFYGHPDASWWAHCWVTGEIAPGWYLECSAGQR